MNVSRKLNLLVVDDSSTIVTLVSKMLQASLGDVLEVTAFSSPLEAVKFLDGYCCDILLSDIEMPGVSGIEMLRQAKSRNAWTQVIFMTAHSSCDYLAEAIENGASDYLLKPIDRGEMVGVVSQCASRVTRWHKALRGTLRPTVVSA
ncbi:MAG TPA: response regulator [Pirellulaceae bacterium]|nr:response regulator [Pirellulaceae bacterium]